MHRLWMLIGLGVAANCCPATPALALQGPACATLHSGAPEFQRIRGGEVREVYSAIDSGSGRKLVWTCEEGGRITRSINGGTIWNQAVTPTGLHNALLDIQMFYNTTTSQWEGYAVGKDGVVLHSTDAGANWSLATTLYEYDCSTNSPTSEPATLWGVFFKDSQNGWICGDEIFVYTTNGGTSWQPVTLSVPTGTAGNTGCWEFYSLDFLFSGNNLVGLATAERESTSTGIVFQTTDGVNFTLITSGFSNVATDFEAWDVEFEPNPSSISAANVFLVGGPDDPNNGGGQFFSSANSGTTWTEEAYQGPASDVACTSGNLPCGSQTTGGPGALYGVAALSQNGAIAVGYGGGRYKRVQVGSTSTYEWLDLVDRCDYTAPLNCATAIYYPSTGASVAWVGGTFGYLRRTDNAGGTWTDQRPDGFQTLRLLDMDFVSTAKGWIVGTTGLILSTTDQGCTFGVDQNGFCTSGLNLRAVASAPGSPNPQVVTVGDGGSGFYLGSSGWSTSSTSTSNGLRDVAFVPTSSAEFWAVGLSSTVLRSTSSGASFSAVTSSSNPLPSGIAIQGLAMLNSNEGFLVGNDSSNNGRIFTVRTAASAPDYFDVTPALSGGAYIPPLKAVAASGSTLTNSATVAFAVGDSGAVLKWVPNAGAAGGGSFTCTPTVYEPTGLSCSGSQATALPLLCVEIIPGTTQVLAGGEFGLLLRFPADVPTSGSLSLPNTHTSKQVRALSYLSNAQGYLLGQTAPPSLSERQSNQADCTVLIQY